MAADPESEPLRSELLFAYCGRPELHGDPRRIEHVRWYVERFGHYATCRSPMTAVDSKVYAEGHHVVLRQWELLHVRDPRDADIVRGLAEFLCGSDRERAISLLRDHLDHDQTCAGVWLDLGGMAREPAERLRCLQRALLLGHDNPNLQVWIGKAALDADDHDTAASTAQDLLAQNAEARAKFGDKLDWTEEGNDLWERARAAYNGDREAASSLVTAISCTAYQKHWAHTIKGLLAVHQGRLQEAAEDLRRSAEVARDCRLSSYGPSMDLADALCQAEMWEPVSSYLQACSEFWQDPRLERWQEKVGGKHRPNFAACGSSQESGAQEEG